MRTNAAGPAIELDLAELERLASDPEAMLAVLEKRAGQILDQLDTLPPTELTSEDVLERFADLQDLHHNVPSQTAASLLAMLAMGRRQLADGKTVSLEDAIEYAKRSGRERDIEMPMFSDVEEAIPGPLTDRQLAHMLAGGSRKGRR